MYIIICVSEFAVDFGSYIILEFNILYVEEKYGVVWFFFRGKIDEGYNIV